MSDYDFKPGDRVYHTQLRMVGEFQGRDPWDTATSEVYFPALGEARRITHDRLEPAGER